LLNQPPARGDAFIILGRQYCAAFYNKRCEAQADPNQTDVELIEEAKALLELRKEFLRVAERLDEYVNGNRSVASYQNDEYEDEEGYEDEEEKNATDGGSSISGQEDIETVGSGPLVGTSLVLSPLVLTVISAALSC